MHKHKYEEPGIVDFKNAFTIDRIIIIRWNFIIHVSSPGVRDRSVYHSIVKAKGKEPVIGIYIYLSVFGLNVEMECIDAVGTAQSKCKHLKLWRSDVIKALRICWQIINHISS